MVALEVHVQKLLLTERFVTLGAGKWLLASVCSSVHYHVAFLWVETKKRSRYSTVENK